MSSRISQARKQDPYICARTRLTHLYAVGLQADGSQWVEKGRMTQGDLFNRYWCYNMECAQVNREEFTRYSLVKQRYCRTLVGLCTSAANLVFQQARRILWILSTLPTPSSIPNLGAKLAAIHPSVARSPPFFTLVPSCNLRNRLCLPCQCSSLFPSD